MNDTVKGVLAPLKGKIDTAEREHKAFINHHFRSMGLKNAEHHLKHEAADRPTMENTRTFSEINAELVEIFGL